MRNLILIALIAAGATGCESAAHREMLDAKVKMNTAIEDCRQRYDRTNPKTAVERTQCLSEAERIAQKYSKNQDLIELRRAKAIIAAEKFQKGQITYSEYDLAIAQAQVETANTATDRANSERMVEATEEAASAAQRAAHKTYICDTSGSRSSSTTYCY